MVTILAAELAGGFCIPGRYIAKYALVVELKVPELVALMIAWVRDTQPEIVGKVMLITFEFGFITKLCTLLQPLASVIVT